MAITYIRAPLVAIGDKPTSKVWNATAGACNSHFWQGVGDPTWRLWYKVISLARSIRGPVDDAYPAQDEWLSHYMLVPPGEGPPSFDPENDVNPLWALSMGSATYGMDDESRINFALGVEPLTAVEAWELAKSQRGAIDIESGVEGAPALAAARAHRPLVQANLVEIFGGWTPFLRNFGGSLGILSSNGACPGGLGEAMVNTGGEECFLEGTAEDFALEFTSLRDGLEGVSWPSHCRYDGVDMDCNPIENGSNWKTIEQGDDEYIVTQWDGTVVRLKYGDYILGPYRETSAQRHTDTPMAHALLQWFASEFRGTEAERAGDGYRVRSKGFDFQRFFTSQYRLAPAMGSVVEEGVEPYYPTAGTEETERAAGDLLPGGFSGMLPVGLVLLGVKVSVSEIVGMMEADPGEGGTPTKRRFAIEDSNTEVVLETIELSADGESVVYFSPAKSVTGLRVRSLDGLHAIGYVTFEFALVLGMKPRVEDAYVMLRLGTTTGEVGGLDSIGQTTSGKRVGDLYFSLGALVNVNGAAGLPAQAGPEDNPLYETARRMISDRMRLIKRPQLAGYAVEDGKSVLWFKRFVTISGDNFDGFRGIAPSLDAVASGSVRAGVIYVVRGGSITYGEDTVEANGTFTGVTEVTTFEVTDGVPEVFEVEGILSTAPRHGMSNEWQMFMSSNFYNDSEGSTYKPDIFGDIQTWLQNRCLVLGNYLGSELCDFAAYGNCLSPPLVHAPSAYSYFDGHNKNEEASDATRAKVFKSCQMYPADYRVESCTYDPETQEVRLVFDRRFQNCSVDESIAREDGPDSCAGEDYRTDENIVRQYLRYDNGDGDCVALIGDAADLGAPDLGAHGSCHPRFFFTKASPKFWVDVPDDNDVQDTLDTRVFAPEWQWLVFKVDAMCSGFLDHQALDFQECPTRPIVYTMESLCLQTGAGSAAVIAYDVETGVFDDALGGSYVLQGRDLSTDIWLWVANLVSSPTLPPAETTYAHYRLLHVESGLARAIGFAPEAVRPDRPMAHGPFSNMEIYAGTQNRVSNALNLLTRAPVELPYVFEQRERVFEGITPMGSVAQSHIDPDDDPAGEACAGDSYLDDVYMTGSGGGLGGLAGDEINLTEISTEDDLEWGPAGTEFQAVAVAAIATVNHGFEPVVTSLAVVCDGGVKSYGIKVHLEYDEIRQVDPQAYLDALPPALWDNFHEALSVVAGMTRVDSWMENTYPTGLEPVAGPDGDFHWGNGGANVTPVLTTGHSTTAAHCDLLPQDGDEVFSLNRFMEEGAMIHASFYWAIILSSEPHAGAGNTINAGAGASRQVNLVLNTNVIGVIEVELV